jgi:transposase-like protein
LTVGGADEKWKKEEFLKHFSDAEKQKAVDLYFGEKLTTQGVVDWLGFPTRQNLERWLRKDPRYGENMRHGFYPVELKAEAVEMYQTGRYTVEGVWMACGSSLSTSAWG